MDGERLRRLREVLILFTLFVLPGIISPGAPEQAFSGGAPTLALTVRNVAFILLLLYLADLSGDTGSVLGSTGATLPTALLITLALFLLSTAMTAIIDVTGISDPVRETAQNLGEFRFGSVLFLLSVAAVEELFFRGYLLSQLQHLSGSFRTSLVIAALLFAVGHGYQGVAGLLFSFSVALFLGILWKWKPNLTAFALGHGLYNLIALALTVHQ